MCCVAVRLLKTVLNTEKQKHRLGKCFEKFNSQSVSKHLHQGQWKGYHTTDKPSMVIKTFFFLNYYYYSI